jgi:hypothetical protein
VENKINIKNQIKLRIIKKIKNQIRTRKTRKLRNIKNPRNEIKR